MRDDTDAAAVIRSDAPLIEKFGRIQHSNEMFPLRKEDDIVHCWNWINITLSDFVKRTKVHDGTALPLRLAARLMNGAPDHEDRESGSRILGSVTHLPLVVERLESFVHNGTILWA